MQRDPPGLACPQVHAIKRGQRTGRELRAAEAIGGTFIRRPEIQLRHFIGIDSAHVGQIEAGIEPAIGRAVHLQVRILEARVGKSEAKREQRLDALPVKPAVADIDAFGISGRPIQP